MKLHTYIHNWPLQHFSQAYGLVSHTTHVVCFNFIREWRDLQFNVDFKQQIFWETFSGQVLFALRDFARNMLRRNRQRNILFFFFHISFWCLIWDTNPGFTSCKPTHYRLDQGDFQWLMKLVIKKKIKQFKPTYIITRAFLWAFFDSLTL